MNAWWAMGLVAVLSIGWCLTLYGWRGNWLMVVATAVYAMFAPADSPLGITWSVVAVLAAFALAGEIFEFIGGAIGTGKAPSARRTAGLALAGAAIGGVLGVFIGLPIPVIGSIVAMVLFAAFGSLAGAAVGERLRGRTVRETWRIGHMVFWGRLWGTLGKTMVGTAIAAIAMLALLSHGTVLS